jgi:hypothetical protein
MDTQWLNRIIQFGKQNSPAILSGVAIGGVIGTAILAVKATPKAQRAILELQESKYDEAGPLLKDQDEIRMMNPKPMEIVKATWKFYIPAGLSGIATIACIAGANKIGTQRNAALVAAYTLVDTSFREYKDKVLEEIGVGKEEKVREKVAQAQIEKAGSPSREVILATGSDQLCFEAWTGRYFRCDIEKIRRAENDINQRMLEGDMCAALNELYDQIGLEHTDAGNLVGWNVDNRVRIAFTSHLHPDGIPCLAFSYINDPRADFGKCF